MELPIVSCSKREKVELAPFTRGGQGPPGPRGLQGIQGEQGIPGQDAVIQISAEDNNQIQLLADGLYSEFIGVQDCNEVVQRPLAESLTLDWSLPEYAWPAGTTNLAYTVGGTDVAVAVGQSAVGIYAAGTPVNDLSYQGDQLAPVNSLSVAANLDVMGTTETLTTQLTLNPGPVGVGNLNFKLFGVDGQNVGSTYREFYQINGYLDGVPVSPDIRVAGDQLQIGNTVTGISPYPDTGAGSENGVVSVQFFSPVDQVEIVFSIAATPAPTILPGTLAGFGLYNINFRVIDTSVDDYTDPSRYQLATCQNVRDFIPNTDLLDPENTNFTIVTESQGVVNRTTIENLANQINLEQNYEWVIRGRVVQSNRRNITTTAELVEPFDYVGPIDVFNPSAPMYVGNNNNTITFGPIGVGGWYLFNYSIMLQKLTAGVSGRVGARFEGVVDAAIINEIDTLRIIGDTTDGNRSIHVIDKTVLLQTSAVTQAYLTVFAENEDEWAFYDPNQSLNPSNPNFPPQRINGGAGSGNVDYPVVLTLVYLGSDTEVNPPI